jgi:thymidine kinase
MVADNYIKQNKRVVILKPAKDTRWGLQSEVKSRAIVDAFVAESVSAEHNLRELIEVRCIGQRLDAVLVEEAQFLSAEQVRQLALVVDELDLPVLCYGLRCSFMDGKLFEGSAALLYWADTIEEVKNVCQYCRSKATKNLLRINGVPQYEGESDVVMGDVDSGEAIEFTPVCRKHYLTPPQ